MKNLCTFPLYAILSMLKTREVFIQVFFIHWEYIIPLYVYVLYSSSRRVGVQVVCKNIFLVGAVVRVYDVSQLANPALWTQKSLDVANGDLCTGRVGFASAIETLILIS